jgi:hypothetical protein
VRLKERLEAWPELGVVLQAIDDRSRIEEQERLLR